MHAVFWQLTSYKEQIVIRYVENMPFDANLKLNKGKTNNFLDEYSHLFYCFILLE